MKVLALLILGVVALSAAAPNIEKVQVEEQLPYDPKTDLAAADEGPQRNILINVLIRQLFAYIRRIINNGSQIFGIPPLDPLELERLHLKIPAGLINLDLDLEEVYSSGVGGFVVHRSNLNMRRLTFDYDISVPKLTVKAGKYSVLGNILTAVPLYGDGDATIVVEGFRFQAVLHLKQSDDGKSVLIDNVQNAAFQIASIKSELTGVIGGGGDIDNVANAMVEEVLLDYINRFQGVLSHVASHLVVSVGNPILELLDTWRFIAPFV